MKKILLLPLAFILIASGCIRTNKTTQTAPPDKTLPSTMGTVMRYDVSSSIPTQLALINKPIVITTTVTPENGYNTLTHNDKITDIEIYDPSGILVMRAYHEHEFFTYKVADTYKTTFTPTVYGKYRVKVIIYSHNWLKTDYINNSALTFEVSNATYEGRY